MKTKQHWKLITMLGLCVVALLPLNGCYAFLGVKHNYIVAKNLKPTMTKEESLATLNDGGVASVKNSLFSPESSNWGDVIADDSVLASLLLSQSRTNQKVNEVLMVTRCWGFMGYGVFHLFFDKEEKLVGYHLRHIN